MIKKLKMKWFLGSVLMVLGLSTSVWGYGLDGYANSTEFKNLLGPYSQGYPSWAWEGGGDPNTGGWTRDNLGDDAMSAYDNFPAQDTSYISDGDILTHIAMEDPLISSHSSGFYRAFNNHYYAPKGGSNNWGILESETNDGDGFTVEWRVKLRDSNNDTAWGLTTGYYFGFNVDECPNLYVRIGGYDGTDSVAKFPGGLVVPIADVTQWHKYRFTVLGNDGSGTIRANFYQDTTLVIEEMPVGVVDQVDHNGRVLFCGTEWGSEIAGGQHTKQFDYVRVDTFGAYAPPPENCGDQGTVYMAADTNKDCMVDYHDFAEIADGLGRCSDPANLGCESRPWIYEDFLSSVWNPTNATSAPMVDGNTNGWDITHEGTLWPGGIVYREDWDPTSPACLRGNANEAGVSQITRDLGERTTGSVSFGYTTGYSPDFGGRVILRTFNTDVMTLRLGTEWNGSAYRGFIETDPTGTPDPNDPIEILTSAGDLPSSVGNVVKVSFDFNTDGIFNIDVRSDAQDWNHALTTTILFQDQFGVTTVPYIDQIRFAGKASKDPHTPADTTIYHSYFCFGRGDGEGIGIDVPKSVCGDFGTSYFAGDITGSSGVPDCYVNLLDASLLFEQWLKNTTGLVELPVALPVIPQGSVTVDGNLSEWGPSIQWTSMDQVYYGLPNDMPNARFALRWDSGTGKIYAAVEIEDTTHWFTDTYGSAWDASDRLEIHCQGDNVGGTYGTDYDEAQQYMVGHPNVAANNWQNWADDTVIDPDAGFDAATSVSGDTITYEIQVTPFNFYGTKGALGANDPTVMAVGSIVRFDLIADTRWGATAGNPGDFGAKAANLMLGKYNNADQFQQYELGN